MNNKQVINYSTRDYNGVISQIDADAQLKEQPTRWKRAIAGIFDVVNNTINSVVNALIPRTAFDRTIMQDVLGLIGYDLAWKETSSVLLKITIDASATTSGSYILDKADIIGSTVGSTSKLPLRFEARANLTFSIGTTESSILVYQQTTQPLVTVGQTNGASWQTMELPDVDVLRETIILKVGLVEYTRVANFAKSLNTDKHYKIYYRSDGTSYVKFGGTDTKTGTQYGFIPSPGQNVTLVYATGGGSISRIAIGEITEYLGTDANVLAIENEVASTGGEDEETIENAREVAPLSIRAVSGQYTNESTGLAIARAVPGVLDIQLVKTGRLTIDAYVLPSGGGLPSSELKSLVASALQEASILQEVSVTGRDPLFVNTNITSLVRLVPGFNSDDVLPYIKLAQVLRSSEVGVSVYRIYYSYGLADAIDEINNLYSVLISASFNLSDDGAQIERLLDNVVYQRVGLGLSPEDLIIASGFVYGLDTIRITNPSSEIPPTSGYITRPTSITTTLL